MTVTLCMTDAPPVGPTGRRVPYRVVPSPRTVSAVNPARVLVGRQTIFGADGGVFGYELLYRTADPASTPVDTWSMRDQDRATLHVVNALVNRGVSAVVGTRPAFINATRGFLTGDLAVPALPTQVGVEVVESVGVDAAVIGGVRRWRAAGHVIAIDDFSGRGSQLRLLPYADIVKVDMHDLVRLGPGLLDLARSYGARTVIERVETRAALHRCRDMGFDLFQGNVLQPALVLDVTPTRVLVPVAAGDRTPPC